MTELELVRWIARQKGVRGLGDDCAIVSLPGSGNDLLLKTDYFIEGVHFLRSHRAADAGRKALARVLSDIAAAGGTPRWCLLSLALAPWVQDAWTRGFFAGLLALARRHRITLVGGDLSHARQVAADVVLVGEAPRGKALRRGGAKPGDGIYVSGALGGMPFLPEPRLALGRALRGRATACMDLSDGLSIDMHRLCMASGVAAVVDRPLPVSHGATLEQALHRGEDYELLFTATATPMRSYRGVPVTRIGTIEKGKPGRVIFFGKPLAPGGYDHFKNSKKKNP